MTVIRGIRYSIPSHGFGVTSDRAKLSGIRVRDYLVDLEHVGDRRSIMTNRSKTPILDWQAASPGRIPFLIVNGHPVRSRMSLDASSSPVSWIVAHGALGSHGVGKPSMRNPGMDWE